MTDYDVRSPSRPCPSCGWRLHSYHGRHKCGTVTLDDGTTLSKEEYKLRLMTGLARGDRALYLDDGECSDSATFPGIDFVRMPPSQIDQILTKRVGIMFRAGAHPPQMPTILETGPGTVLHNMACAVYRREHAVHVNPGGVFQPSRRAQSEGWQLVQAKTRVQRWVLQLFFGDLL
jgi:hypothetical protein